METVMKKIAILVLAFAWPTFASAADEASFWAKPQRGGNSFNRLPPNKNYYSALHDYGATWVRLSYDKWLPEKRDFLMGDADNYQSLSKGDLNIMKGSISNANEAGLKVVIAPLSLPFSRWSQNNKGIFDDRLWQDKSRWKAAGRFWRDLAAELKDTPGIAAYNLINEPAPEKEGGLTEHATLNEMHTWYVMNQGSSRDLLAFYTYLISQIREVDPVTPIMVDSGWYGAADAFAYWPTALEDRNVLYSFHMYEPFEATSGPNLKRENPFKYPGTVPFAGVKEYWDKIRIDKYLDTVAEWSKRVSIPSEKIVVGELGCIRTLDSCQSYLDDVLSYAEENKYHWAFYSFREDAWDAMDYELGKKKVNWKYWEAIEKNTPDPIERSSAPEFEPISKRLLQK